METAIDRAINLKPDVILLSPACASFDFFSNYEERGNFFKKIVKEIELNETFVGESKKT